MKRNRMMVFAVGMLFAVAAFGAVTFDDQTGFGFVGKGDVQTAFGWNNKVLQENASGVSFSMQSSANYSAVCTFITGEGTHGQQTHNISLPQYTLINAAIAYDARTKNQINGFNLNGFSSWATVGTVPVVGEACVANDEGVALNGDWTSVELVSSSPGGLFVNFGGASVPLSY